mmetsp:Transcript_11997/g.34262  ORF Transcript_11997/g.34262 Transcript_11997/m.34262 type:complete len:364 (-) Transcript_11997:134-1225(-)
MVAADEPHPVRHQDLQGEQHADQGQLVLPAVHEVTIENVVHVAIHLRGAEGMEQHQHVPELPVGVAEDPARLGGLHQRRLRGHDLARGGAEDGEGVGGLRSEKLLQQVPGLPLCVQHVLRLLRDLLDQLLRLLEDLHGPVLHGLHDPQRLAEGALVPDTVHGLTGQRADAHDPCAQVRRHEHAPHGDDLGRGAGDLRLETAGQLVRPLVRDRGQGVEDTRRAEGSPWSQLDAGVALGVFTQGLPCPVGLGELGTLVDVLRVHLPQAHPAHGRIVEVEDALDKHPSLDLHGVCPAPPRLLDHRALEPPQGCHGLRQPLQAVQRPGDVLPPLIADLGDEDARLTVEIRRRGHVLQLAGEGLQRPP